MSDNENNDVQREVKFEYPQNNSSEKSEGILDEDSIPDEEVLYHTGTSQESDLYGSDSEEAGPKESDEPETESSEETSEDNGLSEAQQNLDQIEYEKSSETLINEAEASKKINPEDQNKNEGYFFDRQKVFWIVGIVSILTIFFLVFALPHLSKDKTKKEKKMQQATKTWSAVDEWVEPAKEPEEEKDTTPQNSTEVEEEDEEIPPLDKIERDDDEDYSGGSSKPKRPVTNANEQQKSIFRLSLEDNNPNKQYNYDNVRVKNPNQNGNQNYNQYNEYTGGNSYAYTPPALNDNIGRYMASLNGDTYDRQNNQSGKEEFFNRGGTGGQYNWNSEYTLWKGTIIPAVLETAINSDLPGVVIATVTTNVYSSLDGKHLLIPQGSKLYAEYSSSISYGQNRIQVVWNTLIRPDGLEVNLGGLNGVDPTGASGYTGYKSVHPFEWLKAMGLIACFSIVDTKLNQTIANSSNLYTQNVLNDTYSETKKLNNKIVDRALDIQPTIKIPSGKKVDLITNVSMELPPLEPYPVAKKYKRD